MAPAVNGAWGLFYFQLFQNGNGTRGFRPALGKSHLSCLLSPGVWVPSFWSFVVTQVKLSPMVCSPSLCPDHGSSRLPSSWGMQINFYPFYVPHQLWSRLGGRGTRLERKDGEWFLLPHQAWHTRAPNPMTLPCFLNLQNCQRHTKGSQQNKKWPRICSLHLSPPPTSSFPTSWRRTCDLKT